VGSPAVALSCRIGVRAHQLRRIALACACGLLLAAPLAVAQVGAAVPQRLSDEPGGTTWTDTATPFRGRDGARFVYSCPSYGTAGAVWGTDVYTDDSSVCTAAVHAGRITLAGGGTVTIEIRPGEESYAGSARNGVTSSSWGSWVGSFVIVAATPASPGVGVGGRGWHLNAGPFRAYVGARFAYECPAGGPAGTIWGTDVYTDDSSVCTAGVHAGLITVGGGGSVTIEIRAGQTSYAASTRNGITSNSYGAWSGSFVVVGAPGGPPQGTATGTVLVNGKPFTSGQIPYGSTVDVTSGKLTMRVDVGTLQVQGDGKSPARFVPRRTTERVSGKARPLVELKLAGGSYGRCGTRTTASRRRAAEPPKVVRALWGTAKGRFRTRGRYAAATVRGTRWLTTDRCDGTLTTVKQGVVEVRDFTRARTVQVRAGKSYLAPAHR
jgi:hypothetical protein